MARTFQEFEFSNIQIWNFQIQNLEESMKNFDENTKIVFLDQLKWKFWFFEFLKFLKWAGDRDTVVHHHWPIEQKSQVQMKPKLIVLNKLVMTHNHDSKSRFMGNYAAVSFEKSRKVAEGHWKLAYDKILNKNQDPNEILFGFKGEIRVKDPL